MVYFSDSSDFLIAFFTVDFSVDFSFSSIIVHPHDEYRKINGVFNISLDINECSSAEICPGIGFQCENTIGSYLCLCGRHYKMVNETCVRK